MTKFKSEFLSRASAFSLVLAGIAGVATLQPALAQEAETTDADSEPKRLDVILVTATKKGDAVDVQDVAGAITALGSDQIEEQNFVDLQSLSYSMPNVQLEDAGTFGGIANFSIRGLGVNSSIPTIDPTVGTFVDGVYMGIGGGVVLDNFDLEGIEVLRGPQGVLFGRNVTGGAVLLRTKRPSFEPSISARARVETGLAYTVDASINQPLIEDTLAGKLAVYYKKDEGWFENQEDGEKFGEAENFIIRPAFLLTPNDYLEFVLRLEAGSYKGDGPAAQNHAIHDRDSFDFAIDFDGFQEDEWESASLEANWDIGFGDGTITNILAWRDFSSIGALDVDGTTGLGYHAEQSAAFQDQVSNELRYAGVFGPVDVTTGLFYFTQSINYFENRRLNPLIVPVPVDGGGQQETTQYAAFANGDVHVSDKITLNLGLRYTEETKDAQVSLIRPGGCDPFAYTCVYTFEDEETWTNLSPKVGFQFQPSDDTNIYGYWAQGFRSGGYNVRQTDPAVPPGPFNEEKSNAFELGVKKDFDNLRVNAAAFHNTIEDIQREINVPGALGVAQSIQNVGELELYGIEAEFQYFLLDNLVLSGQFGYTEGEYKSLDFDISGDGVIDDTDFDLDPPRLSPWTYGVAVNYDVNLGDNGDLATRVSFSHRDKAYYTDNNLGFLNPVDSLDANISWSPANGHYKLSVFGTNILDEATYGGDTILPDNALFGGDGAGPLPAPTFSPLNKGRVIGAEIRVNY